jgi:ATP-binding cassette subfamily A (ABC1) protein 3
MMRTILFTLFRSRLLIAEYSMGELSALLQKNFIIWKRNKGSLIAEIVVFISFASIFFLFNHYSPRETFPDKRYLSVGDPMTPLPDQRSNPFPTDYAALYKWLFDRLVDSKFTTNMLMKDCQQSGDQLRKTGGYVALSPPDLPIVKSLGKFFTDAMAFKVLYFKDQDAIQNYVRSDNYGDPNMTDPGQNSSLCLGVSFNSTQPGNWRYSVHFNTTGNPSWYDLMDLGQPQVIKFKQEIPTDYHWKNQINSGLSMIQELISNLILHQEFPDKTDGYITSKVVMAPVKQYKSSKLFQNTNNGDISFFIMFPLMINFLKFIYNMINEKEKRITENLRNMGMTMYKHYASWIIFNSIVLVLVCFIWTVVAKLAMFLHSNFFLVFLLIFIPALTLQSAAVFISAFFIKAKSGIIAGIVLLFVFDLARTASQSIQNPPDSLLIWLCVAPAHAVAKAGGIIVQAESFSNGFGFGDLQDKIGGVRFTDFVVVQLLTSLAFLVLGLYLDQVWPSEIGQKRHPLFFILDFCPSKRKEEKPNALLNETDEQHSLNFEQVEAQLQAQSQANKTLKINNLRKVYSNGKVAVENLSLEMFSDQIFALLGHNGAGKTTTISMISGLLEQTTGSINILGQDNRDDAKSNRKLLGVCPQTNPIYENLTCKEHLVLYATIKSKTGDIPVEKTEKEIDDILKDLDLFDKKDYPASKLSGGQKRKLCVACAFIGGSKVILLDEPTSGMDTYARRYLWEMLKSYKKDRIIILSTHYMDEADYLGDRIGIMGKGQLITCGSSLFLKKRFGVGYDLTVVKTAPEVSTDRILETVRQFVPSAIKSGDISMEVKFQLPTKESPKFESLFKHFEDHKQELGIQTFGISLTTLEEVFLKVASLEEEDKEDMKDSMDKKDRIAQTIAKENFELNDIRVKDPVSVFFMHFWALCKKRMIYFKRDKRGLVCEIFLPIIIILAGMAMTKIQFIKESPSGELLPSIISKTPVISYSTMNQISGLDDYFKQVVNRQDGSKYNYQSNSDEGTFESQLLASQRSDSNINRFYSVFVNQFDAVNQKYDYTCFVNTTAPFSVNLCLNMMENVVYSAMRKDANSKIAVDIVPFALTKQVAAFNNTAVGFIAAILVSIAFAFVPASLIVLLVKERENNVKHQQIVSGVSLFAYWLSNLMVDWVKFLIPAGASLIIFKLYDVDVYLNSEAFPATLLMFLFFGPCMITFTYLFSFLFKSPSKAQFVIFLLNYFGGAILLIASFILRIIENTRSIQTNFIEFILRLFPIYDLAFGLFSMANGVLWRMFFKLDYEPGPWDRYCALWSVVYLGCLPVIYFGILMIIEYRGQQVAQNFMSSTPPAITRAADEDEDVTAERTNVENGDDYAVKVVNLIIEYIIFGKGFCQKKKPTSTKVAVKGVTFGVKKGECFGLLGTNGAGKTSTFKVLTGEVIPNYGEALIAGLNTRKDMKTIGSLIGYCPQFDALLENLTAREHLELYAAIKGIPSKMREELIENKLQQLNLKQYENVQAGTYSGGNKRKLSVAMALLGNPPIILLDEPSSGMDPEARRFMWNIVSQISTQNKTSSVILTTHSMEEAEALSSKLAIMVEGRIKCIGPVQQLKSKYGKGFEIEVKIKVPEPEELTDLKKMVSRPDETIDTTEKAVKVLTSVGFNNAEFEFCPNGRCNHFSIQVAYFYKAFKGL